MDGTVTKKTYDVGGDEYHCPTTPRVDKAQLKALSALHPWRAGFDIAKEWAMMVLAVVICEHYFHPALYIATVIFIGTRLHALGVLMHDSAHYRLFPNRKVNDWVSEIFLAWPILITMYGYRRNHFDHHRHLNTEKDPDWVRKNKLPEYRLPKTARQILAICAQYLCGLNTYRDVKMALFGARLNTDLPRHLARARTAFYFGVFALSFALGGAHILLMYWLVPVFTTFLLLLYIRGVADHFGDFHGGSHESIYTQSRTTYPRWWEAFLISPYNINYHIEHHFYPGVPYFNLPKLHKILLNDPVFRQKAHITHGFFTGLFAECRSNALPAPARP